MVFKKPKNETLSMELLGCDIGGAKELGVIYFPTNGGAKEPQNLPNHRVDWSFPQIFHFVSYGSLKPPRMEGVYTERRFWRLLWDD